MQADIPQNFCRKALTLRRNLFNLLTIDWKSIGGSLSNNDSILYTVEEKQLSLIYKVRLLCFQSCRAKFSGARLPIEHSLEGN